MKTYLPKLALLALPLICAPLAHADISSTSVQLFTNADQEYGSYGSSSVAYYMNRQLNDVGTLYEAPVANFPGVGYLSSEASSTASWAASTPTYFDLHGTVYATAVTGASAYDGTYYTSTAVAVGSVYFTLDFDGTATMSLSDVLINTVGPHPSAQLTYFLDSTVYTTPSTIALSAGTHHMQLIAYDSGTSGSYNSPFGFDTYGTYSGGVSGATYDFQVTSSVPEPASIAAIFCGVLGLARRRRKA